MTMLIWIFRAFFGGKRTNAMTVDRVDGQQPEDNPRPPHFSDDALALRFADQHADDRRYVALSSRWLRWNQIHWELDRTLDTFDAARAICRRAAVECNDSKNATSIASAGTVAAIERLARSDRRLAAMMDQFDVNPDLFGAPQTVDLRTGEAYPPRRDDYMTKCAAVAPAPPGTLCPRWIAFLNRVTAGDQGLIGFLQRYVGYSMTGHVGEHVFAFLHGTGANGKGTFINTIATIFGAYAAVVPMDLFMTAKNERHPTELAKLQGVRLAIAHETQQGRHWDEAKIKTLTGGDKLTGRFMRQDFFDFVPTHKFLISGNHKPSLTGIDEAIQRRLLMVPFNIQIPKGERDPDLPEKLKAEWPAILRWALDGCLEWRSSGLMVPEIVRKASEAYFAEQDSTGEWLEECTCRDPNSFTRTRDLFASWKRWAEARNLRVDSERVFSQALSDRGLEKKQDSRSRQAGFRGLRLIAIDNNRFDWADVNS
jgi:putative DNA primase/helicase